MKRGISHVGDRRTFYGVLVVIFLVAAALYHWGQESGGAVQESLAEALFVAVVLAGLVDPYLKRHFAKDIGETMFWWVANTDAPKQHRRAVLEIAQVKQIYDTVKLTFEVSWADREEQVVRLAVRVTSSGTSFDREGFRPDGNRFLLPSTPGYQSRYLSYSFSSSPPGPRSISVERDQTPGRSIEEYVEEKPGGLVQLNEGALMKKHAKRKRVSFGGTFQQERRVEIFRKSRGFFPFINHLSTRRCVCYIEGEARNDLTFSILDAKSGKTTHLTPDEPCKLSPSGILILSWHPRDGQSLNSPSSGATQSAQPANPGTNQP